MTSRAFFSSYRNACEEADVALLAVGDMNRVRRAAQRSSIGKITPSAIYVHESALDRLSPLLRLYEGCARRYIGRVEEGNIIKLHVLEPMGFVLVISRLRVRSPSCARAIVDGSFANISIARAGLSDIQKPAHLAPVRSHSWPQIMRCTRNSPV